MFLEYAQAATGGPEVSGKGLSETRPRIRRGGTRLPLPLSPLRRSTASSAKDAFDRNYWLAHCEGFRVEAIEGTIGFVESVSPGPEGEPMLAVRAGLLGRRVLIIPASSAAFIVPRAQKIWLRSPVDVRDTRDGHEPARHDC
jgi:hypothetical protein